MGIRILSKFTGNKGIFAWGFKVNNYIYFKN